MRTWTARTQTHGATIENKLACSGHGLPNSVRLAACSKGCSSPSLSFLPAARAPSRSCARPQPEVEDPKRTTNRELPAAEAAGTGGFLSLFSAHRLLRVVEWNAPRENLHAWKRERERGREEGKKARHWLRSECAMVADQSVFLISPIERDRSIARAWKQEKEEMVRAGAPEATPCEWASPAHVVRGELWTHESSTIASRRNGVNRVWAGPYDRDRTAWTRRQTSLVQRKSNVDFTVFTHLL